MTEKLSMLAGLRKLRDGKDGYAQNGLHTPRPPMQTQFTAHDPADDERVIEARRAAAQAKREADQQFEDELRTGARNADGERPQRAPAASVESPAKKRPGVRKGQHIGRAAQDRYAHLDDNARAVWRCVADYEEGGQLPTLLQIAESTGLTVSEVSHATRQLENNNVLRRSLLAVAALSIRPEKPQSHTPAPAAPRDLTPETAAVWQFLAAFIDEHGYAPILREIAEARYYTTSAVTRHLDQLEAHEYIARDGGKARSLRLLKRPDDAPIG